MQMRINEKKKNVLFYRMRIIYDTKCDSFSHRFYDCAMAFVCGFCIGKNSLNSAGSSSSEYNRSEKYTLRIRQLE